MCHAHWHRSISVGLSCLLFILPCHAYLYSSNHDSDPRMRHLAWLYGIVTICSFSSDFLFVRQNEKRFISILDRFVATTCGAYTFYTDYSRQGNWLKNSILLVFLVLLFARSRMSRSQKEWEKRHVQWHFASSLIPSAMAIAC